MAQSLFSELAQQALAGITSAAQAPSVGGDDPVSAIFQVAQERGIDPAHLLGLAKLETQAGAKTIKGGGADTRNLFNVKDFSKDGNGIRARDGAEGSNDRYRAYGSYRESVEDLASLLERKYPGALKAGSPEEFASELRRGGYATDPAYERKLASTIRSSGATRPAEPAQEWDQGARYIPMDLMLGTDQPKPAAKGDPEGIVSSMGNAVWQGAKSLGRSVMASGNTAVGDLTDVELLAAAQKEDAKNDPQAMQALQQEIAARKKANPDAKWWQALGDVGGAAWQNKLGTAQLIANQAPNSAVALGGGWAGGVAGAKLGALAAPFTGGLSVPVGATVGALAGMFLGNYAMESGGKAIEKAEGGFTQDEANASMTEGAKKAAVVTGVDALTLGAGKMVGRTVFGAPVRAGARAEAQVLADAGVDITSKAAIAQALATNQALKQTAIEAGKQAAKGASKVGTRVAQAGTGMTMETLGEGTGEYFGEEWATGKGDIYDAALEALSSATQSVPQTAIAMAKSSSNELDPSGIVRAAKQSGGIVSRAGLAATPGAQQPNPAAPNQPATNPGAAAATVPTGNAGNTAAASTAPNPYFDGVTDEALANMGQYMATRQTMTDGTPITEADRQVGRDALAELQRRRLVAKANPQPAQTPTQASALSAIEQALEADKQRRRAAGEVVDDDDVTDVEVKAPVQPGAEKLQLSDERDAMLPQALDLLRQGVRPSVAAIQGKLRIGFNRAARILEEMERDGVVGPMDAQGARQILKLPDAPDNQKAAPSFDSTGWQKSENTTNKNGLPRFPEGVERYTRDDADGRQHVVITRQGEVTQSRIISPDIELENSSLDFDNAVTGRIEIDNLTGKLTFMDKGTGQGFKMSPRASQQFKDGVPLEQIAEQEFSDAGGIRPDGSRTPHTTRARLKDQPIPPGAQATPAQPASAGFSSPKFDNSPIPKMDQAEADEQRRQFAEFEQKRKNRRAGTRAAAWNRNPFLGFLGANGINRDVANEFAPGLVEKRKAFVPGYGPVFRAGAKNLDELVQNAKEDGFLRDDDGEPELYDLIDRALRGERIAPLFADGAAEAEGQRRQQAMQEREGATFDDYLAQQRAEMESDDFDPFTPMAESGYDDQDLDGTDFDQAGDDVRAEVAALSARYADMGFDPSDVLERLALENENQPEKQFYDLAKTRLFQLIEQAQGQAEPAGNGDPRADDAQPAPSTEAAAGQAAPVTPPGRQRIDDLAAEGFSQVVKQGDKTYFFNPDTRETVELDSPAQIARARARVQAKQRLGSLRGTRPQDFALDAVTPEALKARDEQAQAAQAQQAAEQQAAAAKAKADDERRRIEQASYAAADSFELGQNPLDSLTGQKDIFGAAPVAQGLAGEKINDEWTAFDPQSGTLGIPRAEMPQIKAEHRGAMMGFLKARGIDGQQESIPSAAIKPTQAEFSPAKVKQAMNYQGGNRSIIVSADGYVVDGHHQWLAAREKGEPIQAIRLDQNIGDVLAALKDMPSAQPEQGAMADPVASLFDGKPDPRNSAPLQELDGFQVGEAVDVPSRTIGRSQIEVLFKRTTAGEAVNMARIVNADGKKLDVLTGQLVKVEDKQGNTFKDPKTGQTVVVSTKATADAMANSKQLKGRATVRKATEEELKSGNVSFVGYDEKDPKSRGYVIELDEPGGTYEQRNADRIARAKAADTQEVWDAITAEENADPERDFSGTDALRMAINMRVLDLKPDNGSFAIYPDRQETAKPAEEDSQYPLVTHTTLKGKVLRGFIVRGMTLDEVKASIDPYALKKDGGVFVREQHKDKLPKPAASEQSAAAPEPQESDRDIPAAAEQQWDAMTNAERVAIALEAGLPPAAAKKWSTRALANIDAKVRDKLVAAMDARQAQDNAVYELPVDDQVFSDELGKLVNRQVEDDGEAERYQATFNPDVQRISLPRVTSGNAKPAGVEFLPQSEANQIVQSWKDEAARQGKRPSSGNYTRTVISLFDASGVMSRPWEEAGYNVIRYDIQNGDDINDFNAEMLLERHGDDNVWAVIAQPPCTDFASSGAQWWAEKDAKGLTEISNELVRQTMRTLELFHPPVWWLENPVGRMQKLNGLPDPVLSFDPWHFGDPWTKRTSYWGNFNPKLPTAMVEPVEGSKVHKLSSSAKFERSLTPEGVAYAMFMANNAQAMTVPQRLAREFPGIEAGLFERALAAGQTEQDIKNQIEDSFYENDLDTVREILGRVGQQDQPANSPVSTEGMTQAEAQQALEAGQKLLHYDEEIWIDRAKTDAVDSYVIKSRYTDGPVVSTKGPAGPRGVQWGKSEAAKRAVESMGLPQERQPDSATPADDASENVKKLVELKQDLQALQQRIKEQGQVADDRLLERERKLSDVVKSLERDIQKAKLDQIPAASVPDDARNKALEAGKEMANSIFDWTGKSSGVAKVKVAVMDSLMAQGYFDDGVANLAKQIVEELRQRDAQARSQPAGRKGYDTQVELNAAQLKTILEQTRGEPLVDKPAKLEAWRNGTAKTDPVKFPVELVFTPDGKLDVNDGRHRIALAAERGEKVTAFIDGKDAKRAKDMLNAAPGTRFNGASERAAADRLDKLYAQMGGIMQHNTREAAAKSAVRSVIEELRKPRTAISIVPMLDGAANGLDRQYGAMADVIREVADSLSGPAIQDFLDGKRDTAPTLEKVQAGTLDKLEKELADWQIRRELPINQGQTGVIDEEIAKLQAQVDALRGATGQEDELDGEMQGYERKAEAVEAARYLKDFVYSLGELDGMTDRAQVELSSPLGKSGRDTLLMRAFGLTRDEAHDINNRLDSRKPNKLRNVDMQEAFEMFPGLRQMVDEAIGKASGKKPSEPATSTITANPDLDAIFDQLDGITQRTQAAGRQAAAEHPQAERIQFVQKHILDILEDLEDSGKVTINC